MQDFWINILEMTKKYMKILENLFQVKEMITLLVA